MIGYSIADLLLFDFAILVESYRLYFQQLSLLFYGFAFLQICVFAVAHKFPKALVALFAFAWLIPGIFFWYLKFRDIYWPAEIAAYFHVLFFALLLAYGFIGKKTMLISPLRRWCLLVFCLSTIVLSFIFASKTPLLIGADPLSTCIGTILLTFRQKSLLAKTLQGFSWLWLLFLSYCLWALIFWV